MPRFFLMLIIVAMLISGCASNTKTGLKVHHINSLASSSQNDGSFKGLEYLADPVPGKLKNRVNIMYLHGIGWTEDRNNCLLYTSPSPRDATLSRMPSSA